MHYVQIYNPNRRVNWENNGRNLFTLLPKVCSSLRRFHENQVCPRSLRKEIPHRVYGNTTNTSVADTRSETEVIAALGIPSQVSK